MTLPINPYDVIGQTIGDGFTGRITDPVTGAGHFNANTDPNVVGIDPLTGSEAPAGTDVGFGAATRRFLTAGVYNGDFAVPPSDPPGAIVSDTADADYNALPYWRAYRPDNGSAVGALSHPLLRRATRSKSRLPRPARATSGTSSN